jgi:uncharacterized protein (DUF1501 family)
MTFSRRDFLKTASVGFGALIVPQVLLRARPATAAGTDPVLITVFQRGACDGLNTVVPYADPNYYAKRPDLAVPAPTVLGLDDLFGFHPALAPLMPLYQSGRLAVMHCCGSTNSTRSHFDAQDFMDYGAPGDRSITSGWLNRFLGAAGMSDPLGAVTLGTRVGKSLRGPAPSTAISSIAEFKATGQLAFRRPAIETMFASTANPLLQSLGPQTFQAVDRVGSVSTSTGVTYPGSQFAAALKDLAALIKGDIGVRLGTVDFGGWDHHAAENAELPGMLDDLAHSLAAFAQDLGSDFDRTVVLVMTEFGRRVAQNGSLGTDHGRGSVMLAMGGAIAGGRILLRDDTWPGLAPENLESGIDLPVTTDFRNVFAELLTRHMGLADAGPVFPNHTLDPDLYPGLFL